MNRLLILGLICLISFFVCMVIQRFMDLHSLESEVSFILEKFFLAMVESCATYYSWIRGEAVVDIVSPRIYYWLKYAVMVFQVFFFLQVIPPIAFAMYSKDSPAPPIVTYASQGSVILVGVIVVFLDIVSPSFFSSIFINKGSLQKVTGNCTQYQNIV
ncbi:hypothetical protein BCR33DRAFT_20500 [Rhizoclosmatium globosum]|uniref:Uncharacterized protein n=1 Tax=Rhizoclosmatium globosum TaxID=329046 RepID=A0A1Y2CQ66_9FUNG|nr:hypothetical protein BCR33DRAFT_20500 [Rhizoclosmatium globosum]|eukprot:ORY49179.1 hypothetical protein BCR33DRAFT_20500 [Rhizoclosmatium globosum]